MPARPPKPPRPLGREGQRAWNRIWRQNLPWVDQANDIEPVLLYCELTDEYMRLRFLAASQPDNSHAS